MPNQIDPVFETVRSLMAVREYEDRPVPDDVLRRVLEAGHVTASASNIQPWHFVLVRDRERLRKLGSLIRTGPYVAGAAAAVIVAYEKSSGKWGLSDGSRAAQDMMVVAWGDGVGSNWAGSPDTLDGVRQEFGFPDAYVAMAVLALGYPKRRVAGVKKRKPFNEVVSAERFGTPLK